jgi:hypothetical protein
MTGLYRRYRQPQALGDFRDAEIFEIPQENDDPIFFRQPGECSAQPHARLAPLTFDQRRVSLIGDRELSQRWKIERRKPRRGTFSLPRPRLIETNSNQPRAETGFKPKLIEMGERFKRSLLDNVFDVRAIADSRRDKTQQQRQMRRYQISEEISAPAKDLANQDAFLRDRYVRPVRRRCHIVTPRIMQPYGHSDPARTALVPSDGRWDLILSDLLEHVLYMAGEDAFLSAESYKRPWQGYC